MKKDSARQHMTRQHMLSSNYEIYHYMDKTIRNVKLHHHDFYEIYFFISGDVEYYIEGEIYKLKPGDLVLINTTELHQAQINKCEKNYERIVLWINKEFLKGLSSENTDIANCFESEDKKTIINIDFDIQRDIESLFHKLLELDKFKGIGKDLLANAYITELMVKINNLAVDEKQVYDNETKKSALIDEMIDYIEENICEELPIDFLAEKFYLSKYHLSREFKKYTNVSIHKFIKLKRLIQAKEHILQNDSITDVYIKCGFGDYSNFFRAFKQEYGITPKQFYKIMKNKDA